MGSRESRAQRTIEWWRNRNKPHGKSELGATTGGWEMLGGNRRWKRADSVFNDLESAELEQYYRQLVVYACVKRICIAAQEAPLKVARLVGDKWEDDPGHELNNLINKPNPWMSYAEFQWHLLSHLEMTGVTYLWKWRNEAGYIDEMWPVPSSWVAPVFDDGKLLAYRIFQGASKERKLVPVEDVVRQILPDPANPWEGLGPMQAALRDVQTDEQRQNYLIEVLVNNKQPGMILYQPEDWSDEQKQDVRAVFMAGLSNGGRGKTVFMQGEGARSEQVKPASDLDWPGLTNLCETRICAAFQVPPIIIGLRSGLDAATYANYELAEKTFYRGTMLPTWTLLDSGLTKGLIQDEGDDANKFCVYHDLTNVRALREDEDKIALRAERLYHAGLITKNKAIEMIGLAGIGPVGDVYVMPMNLVTDGMNETPLKDAGVGEDLNRI